MVTARAAMPDLIAQGGNVLMISSIAGLNAGPEVCGYVTMKHALIGLAKSITRDFGPKGVRCNTICPGWVRTEMADSEMVELMERKGLATVEEAYALVTSMCRWDDLQCPMMSRMPPHSYARKRPR